MTDQDLLDCFQYYKQKLKRPPTLLELWSWVDTCVKLEKEELL